MTPAEHGDDAPTLATLLADAGDALGAGLEAEVLLAAALDKPRSYLYAWPDARPDAARRERFLGLLARRRRGEPLAYLLGQREFWSLPLRVSPAVLVPRPDTETLVEAALQKLPAGYRRHVVDLGTGSGAVALALAGERPLARVDATDVSAAALAVAAGNAARLGIAVRFYRGSWYRPLPRRDRRYDLIVSNPPYVGCFSPHLRDAALRYEPRRALVAGRDGLDALRAIVAGAPARLKRGGWLLIEHGFDQGRAARRLLRRRGLRRVMTWRDLTGRERVSGGQWAGSCSL